MSKTNIVYYIPFEGTTNLALMITDKSVKELRRDYIPKSSPVLVVPYDVDNLENLINIDSIQYMEFDNNSHPKKLVLRKDFFKAAILEDFREARKDLFLVLDRIQQRALVKGDSELVADIEADKKVLRDITDNVDLDSPETVLEFYRTCPTELLVDYEAKYKSRL